MRGRATPREAASGRDDTFPPGISRRHSDSNERRGRFCAVLGGHFDEELTGRQRGKWYVDLAEPTEAGGRDRQRRHLSALSIQHTRGKRGCARGALRADTEEQTIRAAELPFDD